MFVALAPASSPATQRPLPFKASSARARFGTAATRRCSTAPAEALTTAGVTAAARSSGNHHAGHAGRLGGAKEGADVLRILQMIEHEDGSRRRQQILELRVAVRFGFERDALVIGAAGRVVEHQAGDALDLGAALGRQSHQSS